MSKKKEKPAEEKPVKKGREIDFNFPAYNVTIKATSQEEALKKLEDLNLTPNSNG